jgi:methionyl-tRNA synthetase
LKLPKKILIHSHWTIDNIKMSKSLGNVINIEDLIKNYDDLDNIRYFLLRQGNIVDDSKFSFDLLIEKSNEISDIMGNLLTRSFSKNLHNFENKIELDQFYNDYNLEFENYINLIIGI